MADKVGKTYDAVVTSVKSFGLFVEIADYPIEGLIPMRHLPRDDYTVDQLEICMTGHRGKNRFWLGDSLKVQLVEVDRYKSQITFKVISRMNDGR